MTFGDNKLDWLQNARVNVDPLSDLEARTMIDINEAREERQRRFKQARKEAARRFSHYATGATDIEAWMQCFEWKDQQHRTDLERCAQIADLHKTKGDCWDIADAIRREFDLTTDAAKSETLDAERCVAIVRKRLDELGSATDVTSLELRAVQSVLDDIAREFGLPQPKGGE
jgi:hypothetical protein